MAIELVNSKTGTLHVSSEDDRLLNARTIGGGNYVLYGCECKMTTSNNLHIGEGELLINGGFVRITGGGEDVTISNGAQGQKRNTLVVFDWTKGESDIETTKFVAINGTKTTGTPSDPAYTKGDMNGGDSHVQVPFCRLTLNGLTVGSPVVLFDDFQPYTEFRDSVSHVNRVDINNLKIDSVGGVHIVTVAGFYASIDAFGEQTIWNANEPLATGRSWSAALSCSLGTPGCALWVETDGRVILGAGNQSVDGEYVYGQVVVPAI